MDEQDSDAALMLRLQSGEDSALNELMTRWQRPVVDFIYRYIGHRDDAIDLAQETFVRVFEKRHRYRPTGKFSTWLFTIAANLSRNQLRWRKRHPTVTLESHPPDEKDQAGTGSSAVFAPEKSPAERAEQNELKQAVQQQIEQLPHQLRTAVLLFEYQNLTYHEVAAVLGCTPKAVETRLYRARNILRDALADWRS